MKKKIVFLTVHTANSMRKVDFHFWSEECIKNNMDVCFVSLGFSRVTGLTKRAGHYKGPFNQWVSQNESLKTYQWCPLFHPFSLGRSLLDKMTMPLFSLYAKMLPKNLLKGMEGADIFIIENGAGLILVPLLRKYHPNAKIIYSVCDRIETLTYHPIIFAAEKKSLPHFDAIRVPAQIMIKDYPDHKNVQYIPHGLQKQTFDQSSDNPYLSDYNIISVGDMLFDCKTIKIFAKTFPEYHFHLFGREAKLYQDFDNVTEYGERPFDKIVPFIQYADAGMAPYCEAQNADYLSQSSMKIIQYTYCRLPILAPHFAVFGRDHICGYKPENKESIIAAMEKMKNYPRAQIDISSVLSWDKATQQLCDI